MNPVGVADHVQVVLDDDDRVAQIGEAVQHFEQLAHVVEVQAGGGLVEQVERAAGLALGEFARQLHALRLAAGERGGALAQVDVAQAHIDQGLQLLAHLRHVGQHGERVFDGEVEDVGDGVAVELYGQRFLVVAASVADFALHVDVGHEVHLDAALAVALAGLAAASGDVEAEAAGLVAALARLGQHGEQVADGREDLRVGGRVGARRAADGRLVDADDLVDLLGAGEGVVRAGLLARAVDGLGERAVEDVVDEGAFAAAADAGDHGHDAERDADGQVLQVVLARAGDGEPLAGEGARLGAVQHGGGAGEIASGERLGAGHDLGRRALGDDVAAETARAGAEVEHVVGVADGVFVVLDDQHGVAQVAQLLEGLNQPVVVALVQADGGLVEDVEHAAQPRADLRGQADALALAAGERGGVAVEREVVEADGAEEFQPLDDLAADALGHQRLARREAEVDGRREGAVERQGGEVGDGEAADLDRQRLRAQALAAANGAGRRGHVVHHVLAVAVAARLVDAVAQIGENAVKAGAGRLAFGRPVDQDVLLLRRQIFERELEVDLVAVGGQMDELEQVLRGGAGAEAAVEQGLGPVGDDLGGIEVVERAQAVALRAGAEGGVEAEAARLQLGHVEAAVGAGHRGGEQLLLAPGDGDQHQAVGQLQGLGDGLVEALFDGGLAGAAAAERIGRGGS